MIETLFSKTFAILSLQLLMTWAAAVYTVNWFRKLYRQGKLGITATENEAGELDLELDAATVKPYVWALLAGDVIVFVVLISAGRNDLSLGVPLFCVWSILTGIEVALSLLSIDENLGGRVLAITACLTAGAALIGMRSGIGFTFWGTVLFWALILLILGNLVRLFGSIGDAYDRFVAFCGCAIFTGYLLLDFSRLAEAGKDEVYNTWPVAMDLAIEIYLDVINLFIFLLDLLSD